MSASASLGLDSRDDVRIRPWRADSDFDACADVLREATAHDGFVRVRDGAQWRSTFRQLGGEPGRDCWLAEVNGRTVAYAMAFDMGREDPTTRLLIHTIVVRPTWRERQLEHRLLDLATARLGQVAGEWRSGAEVDVRYGAQVDERETYILRLLEGRGYAVSRYLVEMARSLDGILPVGSLPPGIEARPIAGRAEALRVLAAFAGSGGRGRHACVR